MIDRNGRGLSRKAIASIFWTTCKPETAHSKLDRALSVDGDLYFDFRWVERVMQETDREDYLEYLLHLRGYDPARLQEIKRATKTALQVEELKVERLKEIREMLKLIAEEPGAKGKKR